MGLSGEKPRSIMSLNLIENHIWLTNNCNLTSFNRSFQLLWIGTIIYLSPEGLQTGEKAEIMDENGVCASPLREWL